MEAIARKRTAKPTAPVLTTAEQELNSMKAYVKSITKSKADSIDFLKRAGILDKKTGELSKHYRV